MSSSAATLPSKFKPAIRRLFGSHPGRPLIVITVSLAAASLYWTSVPGGAGMLPFLILTFGWMVVGLVWLIRLGLSLAILKADFFSRRALTWLLPPVLLVSTATAALTGVATAGRFYVSRPALDSYARSFLAGEADRDPLFIGTYPVKEVQTIEDGVRFLVRGAEFLDEYGFAYSPNRRPERIGEDNYVHLNGPWYVWEKSW